MIYKVGDWIQTLNGIGQIEQIITRSEKSPNALNIYSVRFPYFDLLHIQETNIIQKIDTSDYPELLL